PRLISLLRTANRFKGDRMSRGPREQGRRLAAEPGALLVAVVLGEEVPRLPARHMQDRAVLVTWRNHHPLARAEGGRGHAHAQYMPRLRLGGHVEPPPRNRYGQPEGMPHPHPVRLAPRRVDRRRVL